MTCCFYMQTIRNIFHFRGINRSYGRKEGITIRSLHCIVSLIKCHLSKGLLYFIDQVAVSFYYKYAVFTFHTLHSCKVCDASPFGPGTRISFRAGDGIISKHSSRKWSRAAFLQVTTFKGNGLEQLNLPTCPS